METSVESHGLLVKLERRGSAEPSGQPLGEGVQRVIKDVKFQASPFCPLHLTWYCATRCLTTNSHQVNKQTPYL